MNEGCYGAVVKGLCEAGRELRAITLLEEARDNGRCSRAVVRSWTAGARGVTVEEGLRLLEAVPDRLRKDAVDGLCQGNAAVAIRLASKECQPTAKGWTAVMTDEGVPVDAVKKIWERMVGRGEVDQAAFLSYFGRVVAAEGDFGPWHDERWEGLRDVRSCTVAVREALKRARPVAEVQEMWDGRGEGTDLR